MMFSVKKLNGFLGAFFLGMLIFLCSGVKVSASSTGTGATAEETPLYALTVGTGAADGSEIGIISIIYQAEDGRRYTEFFFPSEGIYQNSLNLIQKAGVTDQNKLTKRNNAIKAMGYQEIAFTWTDWGTKKPFESNSQDTFILEFKRKITKVFCVRFISDTGSMTTNSTVEWDCEGFKLYKINKINGMKMQGYLSNNFAVSYDGELIASSTGQVNKSTFKLKRGVSDSDREVALAFWSSDYGNAGNKYLKNSFTEEEKKGSTKTTDVYVQIDLADVYGGGLESVNALRDVARPRVLPELLTLTLVYRDTAGNVRDVTVPVLASAIAYATEKGAYNYPDVVMNYDFLGQAESLVLKLEIQDFGSLYENSKNIVLTYSVNADTICGLKEDPGAKTIHDSIKDSVVDNKDTISLLGISVYIDIPDAKVHVLNDYDTVLKYEIDASPDYNYSAGSTEGQTITASGSDKTNPSGISFLAKEYKEGDILRPVDTAQHFIVVMKTTDLKLAATTDELYLELGYTATKGGPVQSTESIKVSDAVREYYGYWPEDDSYEDAGYAISTRPGGYIYALVDLNGVYQFTSATLSLKQADGTTVGTDSWQCQDFMIYQVGPKALSGRHFKRVTTPLTNGAFSTKRIYWRPFNKEMINVSSTGATLSTSNQSVFTISGVSDAKCLVELLNIEVYLDKSESKKTIDFESKVAEKDVVSETDWRDSGLINEMSYEETKQDLGFATKKWTYTVTVNVGTEEYVSENGDAGSSNYFYFQLVFQKGKSAFVQANQQLTADGFIAGEKATFKISTNYNYGEVESINIIPDDSSSTSNPYDKLKIDSIEVKMDSGELTILSWTATTTEDNAWVGIDYVEEAEDANSIEKKSRELSEYMRTYQITEKQRENEILAAICTGPYTESSQLEATSMKAIFHVTRLDNTSDVIEVNVLDELYNFTSSEKKKNSKGTVVTDKDLMLNAGQWNFFKMYTKDVQSFDWVELSVESAQEEAISWTIQDFYLYRVTRDDGKKISPVNGGAYVLNGDKETITSLKPEYKNQVNTMVVSGDPMTYVMHFIEQDNPVSEITTEDYEVKRVPDSENDYLNIAVYMNDNGTDYSGRNMDCYVTYSSTYDTYYKSTPELKQTRVGTQTVYYANGLGARNMTALATVYLRAESNTIRSEVHHILVQRVRSGVVMEKYYISGMNINVATAQTFRASGSTGAGDGSGEYQIVTLMLGENTSSALLEDEIKDVAVALKYRMLTASDNSVYQSGFVFLTDQDIVSIGPRRMLKLKFKEESVKEITGLVVAVTGSEQYISLESASVGTYAKSADLVTNNTMCTDTAAGTECTGWYSIDGENEKIQAGRKEYSVLESKKGQYNAIVPMSITFKTREGTADMSQMGLTAGAKVEMNIMFTRANGENYVRKFSNILDYCQNRSSTSFTNGSEDAIFFMEQDMTKITGIVLNPYDDKSSNICTWGIESVSFSYGDGAEMTDFTIPVNQIARENATNETKDYKGLLIGVQDVYITVNAETENGRTGEIDKVSYENGDPEIPTIRISKPGGSVKFSIDVRNSTLGATVRAGRTTKVDATSYLSILDEENSILEFTPPSDDLEEEITYTVEVISKENPSAVSGFYVVVEKGLIDAKCTVKAEDTLQGTAPEFTFIMNKTAISDAELTVQVNEKEYVVQIPKGSTSGTLTPEIPDTFYGTLEAVVLKASGGGYMDTDFSNSKGSCKVKSVGEVKIAADKASVKASEDIRFILTTNQAAVTDLSADVQVNGKTYTVAIAKGDTSGELVISGLNSGVYYAVITATTGGFDQTNIAAVTAQCEVEAAELSLTTPPVSDKTEYKAGDTVVLSIHFDQVLSAPAEVHVTVALRKQTFVMEKGVDSGEIQITGLAAGTYNITIPSVTYYGTDCIQIDKTVTVVIGE